MSSDPPDKRKSGCWKGCFVTLFVFVALAASATLWMYWQMGLFTPHPSDEELTALLRNNREAFETLVLMVREDSSLSFVSETRIWPEDAISTDRWNDYRRILKSVNFDPTIRLRTDNAVWFIISSKGALDSYSWKGLIYGPTDPNPIYDNLNDVPDDLEDGIRAYRHVEGDWYIIYNYSV